MNPRIDGPLTSDEQRIVTRIIQPFLDIDRSLIEGLVRLGYSESEIITIIKALELNASTANIRRNDPKRIPWINRALTAIIQRFKEALNAGQHDLLLSFGYTPGEIGNSLFINLLPTAQLLTRTTDAYTSDECDRLAQLGYIDVTIRALIRAGFTVSQLRALVTRVKDARRKGRDAQGLTIEQLNDLLFKNRTINEIRTLGIIPASLSGITSKMREAEVARCIIDCVIMFDVPYGLWGADGQVDVATQQAIIEAKVNSVTGNSDVFQQIQGYMVDDVINPPDTRGQRKSVILYAPGYGNAATASIREIGGHVVKSCAQLREQIRQPGGP